ncbi:MAG: DMT family transporter [Deferrisomatales bacterium]
MDGSRKAVDGFAASTMLLLCSIWGLQQVIIKVAAPHIAPILQLGLRCGISAVLVGLVMGRRGVGFSLRDGTLGPGLLAGVLFGFEFLFIAEGLRFTTASHMVVFLYTAPAFTALGLHRYLPAERLHPLQWLGVAVAFAGIAVAFAAGAGGPGLSLRMLGGDLLGVLAGLAWGATTVIIRVTPLSETPPTKTLLYQLVGGFVVMMIYAVVTGQATRIDNSGVTWAVLTFHGLVVSFATYLTWFWLLRRYLAARLAVFSFMTPLFGVGFGVWLLNDPVSLPFGVGAVLVVAGIALVSWAQRLRRPVPVPAGPASAS